MNEDQPRLVVKIDGVVLPAWLAVCLGAAAFLAAIALLLLWTITRDMSREIRVLQLHTQDIESVLIRSGTSTRDDFAAWGTAPQRTRPPTREQEK